MISDPTSPQTPPQDALRESERRLRALLELSSDWYWVQDENYRFTVREGLVLERNAAAVILAHNHPSGVGEPSHADQALTDTLKKALALVDVRVLDHFIVAGNAPPVSFAERGLL